MDRRRNTRLEVSLPCRICSPRYGPRLLTGVTKNMSRGDVLVLLDGPELDVLPCVGDPLIVEIDLPLNHAFGQKCMQCQAAVVRVSRQGSGPVHLAMRIHKMRFQNRAGQTSFEEQDEAPVRHLVM
jgi:PilZ domain